MTQRDDEKAPGGSKTDNQAHKPAKHIEETARLSSSVEKTKDPSKVKRTKD